MLIVSFMGVREKIRGKVFLALLVSLWAMHEEIKKQKKEKQRTKTSEKNVKHNIDNFYLVVRFRKISFL